MRTSPPFRLLRTIMHMFCVVLIAVLLCLLFLIAADLLRHMGMIFSDAGGDAVLSVGRWKFIFREELLIVMREKWNMLCRAAHTIFPAPLSEPSENLIKLIIHAFVRR